MNIRDFEYIVAVAKYQSFGKAAEACFVSQPTLSMQIKKLEEELQISIFERNNKRLLITPIGVTLIERAKSILQTIKEIQEIALSSKNPEVGSLKIGCFPTLAPYLFPLIIPGLSNKYTECQFLLVEEKTDVLVNSLNVGELDAVILANEVGNNFFEHQNLFVEPFYLAIYKNHFLAKHKSVKSSDLRGLELLLLDEGHCFRDQALEVCSSRGANERADFRATSLEALRQMVAARAGITLMPKLAINNQNSLIQYIPFSKTPPSRQVQIYWRKSSPKNSFIKKIAAEIKSLVSLVPDLNLV